jgi:putative nucleotidyltransferase with HDIG domain
MNAVIRSRDRVTASHSIRVAKMARSLARRLGLPSDEATKIGHAALLHDIGKLAVPDAILFKPHKLSNKEEFIMRRHTIIGEKTLLIHERLRDVAPLVRHHHERFDGTGYPDGLSGEGIPYGARVIAVVDAFDAMTQGRPYSDPIDCLAAELELLRCSGTQFDPSIVRGFVCVFSLRSDAALRQSRR